MKRRTVDALGFILSSPIRREIVRFLSNPAFTPKTFTKIQDTVSREIKKPITNGNLGHYLINLRAKKIIDKDEKKYWLTEFGEELADSVNDILQKT